MSEPAAVMCQGRHEVPSPASPQVFVIWTGKGWEEVRFCLGCALDRKREWKDAPR